MAKKATEDMAYYTPGERLLLLCDYLLKHSSKEHPATTKEILDYLKTFDIHISVKTLYIDLDKLRFTKKLEIEYNPKKWGYWVKNPPFEPHELRLMVDSVQASKFITQEQARKISRKITDLADVYTKTTLNRQAYVVNRIHSMNESIVKDSDKLHACISMDCKVGFRYFHYTPQKEKQYSKNGNPYIVSPFALLWNDGYYYLYAYSSEKKDFLHFRIDRMERISVLTAKRDGKEEFKKKDLNARQTKIFNMYGGKKEYTVRLRCINALADAMIDRFGKEIMMIPTDDNHFTVSVQIEVSDQFYAWICSFGRRIKILDPAPVVEGMSEYIGKIAEMYQNGEK